MVTLCGLHRALPIAAGRSQLPAAFQSFEWLKSLFAALLRIARAAFAKHNFSSLRQDPRPFGVPKAQNVFLDTRGMWKDSFEATSWAYKHVFTRCNLTHETIAIQVHDSQRCVARVTVAAVLTQFHTLLTRQVPGLLVKPPLSTCTGTYIWTSNKDLMVHRENTKQAPLLLMLHASAPTRWLHVTQPTVSLMQPYNSSKEPLMACLALTFIRWCRRQV